MITQTSCCPFNDSILIQEYFHGVTGLEGFSSSKKRIGKMACRYFDYPGHPFLMGAFKIENEKTTAGD